MIVEAHKLAILRRERKRRRAKVEPTLLERHERSGRKEAILRTSKDLLEHAPFHAVQRKDHLPRVQIQQTPQHRTALPDVQIVWHRAGVVPNQLPAPVERYRVRVVPNAVPFVAQKVRVLGRPTDLHDAGCDDEHLVVPAALVHLERTPDALERVRVAARFQPVGGNLQVLADVPGVEHHAHVAHVRHLVRVLAALDEDWGKRYIMDIKN